MKSTKNFKVLDRVIIFGTGNKDLDNASCVVLGFHNDEVIVETFDGRKFGESFGYAVVVPRENLSDDKFKTINIFDRLHPKLGVKSAKKEL